jgi:hypothetical protein
MINQVGTIAQKISPLAAARRLEWQAGRHGGHCDSEISRGWNGAGVLFDGLREPVFCRFQDVLLLLLCADLFAFFSPRG